MCVDSYSKWIEVKVLTSMTAQKTVETVRPFCAFHGLSRETVTDKGPHFRSKGLEYFLLANSVKHTLIPPYHPVSKGAAERFVQTAKGPS